uniref:F-box domain-containing protein n=1 Tax=Solanum lycopersicum TaxID=4081 RepID=A0A3Q7G6Y4_SOLLC
MDGGRPIPEDVVVDILLRLPVESLLRFKCVHKSWRALIKKIAPGVTPEQKTLLQLPRVADFSCVAGPVDDLFLVQKLFYGEDVCLGLWNPATREFRSLSPAPFEIESFFSHHNQQYGLGFDLLTLDYKVVWLRGLWDDLGLGDYNRVYVCVYSLCNNSWKHLTLEFPP